MVDQRAVKAVAHPMQAAWDVMRMWYDSLSEAERAALTGRALTELTEAIHNHAAAARPFHMEDQWQPIETAPKDGTQVLIAGGTVEYDAECFPEDRPFGGVHIASWCGSSKSWAGPYGSEYDAQYWHNPTHWQPLPAPPRTAGSKTDAPASDGGE